MYFPFFDFCIHDGSQTTQIGLRPELGFVMYENQVYVVNPFHDIFDIARELQQENGIPVYGLLDNPNIEIGKFCFEELYPGEEIEDGYDFDYDVWYCRGSAKVSDVMEVVGETDDNPMNLTELFINETKQEEIAINETIEYHGYQIKCVSNIGLQEGEYGFLISK
ncbi:MAG: hypothetical protein HUJ58_10400 [Erysipelotrichaceae bacterium]|nr:hypothetical protein [Erysipelotrichaceae bacterium]